MKSIITNTFTFYFLWCSSICKSCEHEHEMAGMEEIKKKKKGKKKKISEKR